MNYQKAQRILIVNDNPDQLEMLAIIFAKAGYAVIEATDGIEGYRCAQQNQVDLIISDVMMPNCDGIEFCKMVRADEKLRHLPFMLASAMRRDVGNVVAGLEIGADDYLEIPVDPLRLVARAARLLERKQAEDVLRSKEHYYRSLIENVSDIITIRSLDGEIFYESPSIEQVLGFRPEDVVGKNTLDFVHPDDAPKLMKCLEKAAQTLEKTAPMEFRYKDARGEWRTLESIGKVVFDPVRGQVAVINHRDVTERRAAEKALRENEEKFRAQYKGFPLPTYTWQRSDDDFVMTDFNAAADTITGGATAQFLGAKASQMYADIPELVEAMHRCFDERRIVRQELDYLFRVSPHVRRLDVTYVFVPPDIVMIHTRDITEEREAKSALEESERKFRKVLENSRDVIYQFNLQSETFDYMSPAALELSGYEASRFLEGGFEFSTGLLHPDDLEPFLNAGRDALARSDPKKVEYTVEYRLNNKDKGYRWISENRAVIKDENNRPTAIVAVARDITERRMTLHRLRESEEKYRIVAETATDGIITIDAAGTILFVNAAAERIFGYESDEMLGQKLTMLMPDYLRKDQERSPAASAETGERHINRRGTELEGLRKNGDPVDIEVSFGESEIGESRRFTGIIRDITERKSAEQRLIESEKRYRFVAEAMPQQVWTARPDGGLDYVNRRFYEYFGFEAEAIDQIEWSDIIHPDDFPTALLSWEQTMLTNVPYEVEFRLKGGDGVYHWHLSRATAMRSEKGEIIKWFGTNTDIDQLKKAEAIVAEANDRALREYDDLLQRVSTLAQTIGAAHEISAIFTAILDFARASVPCSALIISLLNEEKNLRQPIYLWYHGEELDTKGLKQVRVGEGFVGRAVRSGEVLVANQYIDTVKKRKVMVRIGFDEDSREPQTSMIAPMKIKGDVIGVIEVQSYEPEAYRAEHVTAMRMAANLVANALENVRLLELEREGAEQLRQAQKLESVGRLAGGIAHDFNNMLTAINGYSDLTLRQLAHDDPLRRNLEEIKKAGERSAALTNQLLAFSRRQVLQRSVLEINDVILETLKMLQRLIGEDIQIKTALSPQIGLINGDAAQLSQVIMNLAVNARDAMPKGGKLTIETANVHLDRDFAARHVPTQPGSYVRLSVKDTGIGISREMQEHIFEPFFTTKDVGKGTGLGLATVYGIIKQSGGYIWIDSELGRGTTFDIYLPRIEREAKSPGAAGETLPEVPGGNETILIVEDEDMVRSLARQILEECGYRVVEARNGVEALAVLEETDVEIDLLLTDVIMPQMGGRDLSERLLGERPGLRVLLMSGYSDEVFGRDEIIARDIKLMPKPFTFIELASQVRECLDAPR